MNELVEKIRHWANARDIISGSSPSAQTLKLVSEVGELADNVAKGRYTAAQDDIGDCLVVLTILCEQLGYTLEECLSHAYDEIKDRRGKMVDGIFIKEDDK